MLRRIPLRFSIPAALAILSATLTAILLTNDWSTSRKAFETRVLRSSRTLGEITAQTLAQCAPYL